MKLTKKITIGAITALIATSSIMLLTQPLNSKIQAADTSSDTVLLTHNSYVYNDQGERKKTYQGQKKPVFTAGAKFKYLGGKTYNNKGKRYYYLGDYGYIKAANAKPITNQEQSDTLWLNHNAYIYNKNGHRLKNYRGNKKLYWGHTIKYVGETQPVTIDSKKYYLLNDDNYHQSWLPYRTIKGNQYYNLGKGGYVKAANVGKIAGQPLYTSEATVTLIPYPGVKDIPVEGSNKEYKKGDKVTVDGITGMYNGNRGDINYRIKGTKTAFIDENNIKVKPRQKLKEYTKRTYITVLNNTDNYNIQGEKKSNKTPKDSTAFIKGINMPVSELLYIWIPSKGKAELFYRLQDLWSEGIRSQQSTNFYENNRDNLSYIKATDVKYVSGPMLKPENTTEEAKKDITIASKTDKQALQQLINQEATIKNSNNYKNTDNLEAKNAYDGALKIAKAVNSSSKSSIIQVKQAVWLLNKNQKNIENPEPTTVLNDSFPI